MDQRQFIDLMSSIGVNYTGQRPKRDRFKKRKMFRPLFTCKLRGFEYFEGNRIVDCLEPGSQLFLQTEKLFEQDKCTVAVYYYQFKIGYLPNGFSCAGKPHAGKWLSP